MPDWDPAAYGDAIADLYDEWYACATRSATPSVGDVEGAVEMLAALAGDDGALELGIGTGRLALPLAARGIEVRGIDASPAMVARLRAKPGGADLAVTVADFGTVPVEGRFGVVFCAFSTLFQLPSRSEQQACFAAAAGHLSETGRFVVEAFVPEVDRAASNIEVRHVDAESVVLGVWRHDHENQTLNGQLIDIRPDGLRMVPLRLRYAAPDDLDAMAAAAGLEREHRWEDWRRSRFTSDSAFHVSVYALHG